MEFGPKQKPDFRGEVFRGGEVRAGGGGGGISSR